MARLGHVTRDISEGYTVTRVSAVFPRWDSGWVGGRRRCPHQHPAERPVVWRGRPLTAWINMSAGGAAALCDGSMVLLRPVETRLFLFVHPTSKHGFCGNEGYLTGSQVNVFTVGAVLFFRAPPVLPCWLLPADQTHWF